MKAILVIELDDDFAESYKNFTVDYDLRGIDEDGDTVSIRFAEEVPLKPMPQKKEETFAYWIARGCNDPESYINGWNACLDKILGEAE